MISTAFQNRFKHFTMAKPTNFVLIFNYTLPYCLSKTSFLWVGRYYVMTNRLHKVKDVLNFFDELGA